MAKPFISVRFHGMKGIRSRAAVQADISPPINDAMEELTKDIAAMARQLAPIRTGKLRRSIRASQRSSQNWQVVAGNRKAWYARLVEFGTRRSRSIPFLRPAFESYREKIRERIRKAIMDGLKAGAMRRGRPKKGK